MQNKNIKMKTLRVGLLVVSPILIGYIYNILIFMPNSMIITLWLMPIAQLCYWFVIGGIFAQIYEDSLRAIITGNIAGIISYVIYIWQFLLVEPTNRILGVSMLSQMFSIGLVPITSRLGILFENNTNKFTQTTLNAMQPIGLGFMISIFAIGYFMNKRMIKNKDA